jgi:hypothetical protein
MMVWRSSSRCVNQVAPVRVSKNLNAYAGGGARGAAIFLASSIRPASSCTSHAPDLRFPGAALRRVRHCAQGAKVQTDGLAGNYQSVGLWGRRAPSLYHIVERVRANTCRSHSCACFLSLAEAVMANDLLNF